MNNDSRKNGKLLIFIAYLGTKLDMLINSKIYFFKDLDVLNDSNSNLY